MFNLKNALTLLFEKLLKPIIFHFELHTPCIKHTSLFMHGLNLSIHVVKLSLKSIILSLDTFVLFLMSGIIVTNNSFTLFIHGLNLSLKSIILSLDTLLLFLMPGILLMDNSFIFTLTLFHSLLISTTLITTAPFVDLQHLFKMRLFVTQFIVLFHMSFIIFSET